jgi:hypothetical protein
MIRNSHLLKLLPLVGVCALIVLGSLATAAAFGNGNSNAGAPEGRAGNGLTPFITQGGNAAVACSDVDTCTTGAITNVAAGDALVVVVTEYTTSVGAPSLVEEVTTGGDNDLTELGATPCVSGSGHGVTAIYGLADVAAEASVTFTANYPADEYYTIHALDVKGTATSPFETIGTGICSSAAGTTGTASATTTQDDDLVILGVEIRASTAVAATGGDTFVNNASTTGTDLDSGALLDEIDPTTGTISLSATFTSASWAAIAIGLKAPPLVSGTVTPSTAAIDADQDIALTTTAATGGTAPITYQWYTATSTSTCSSGTLIHGATGQSYTTPDLAVGTYYYCVWATDSSTPTNLVAYSNVATITVNPALSVTITPSAPSIDHGQTVQLTANPSGGTGSDTYAWYEGATCTGTVLATTQAYTTPALTATTTYCVATKDSAPSPETATATATVTVSASALSVTITPAAPSIDSGQTVQLTAHAAGGTGADTYAWYSGATCTGTVLATTQAYTTPALTSTTEYCVAATDSSYEPVTATATATVTVSGSPLSVTITPNAPSIDTGQTVQLTANPSGGTGADTYAWYSGASCTGTVLATTKAYMTPALTVTTTYCVSVTDSAYSPATATATDKVTVSASPLTATITPSAPSIDSGQTVQLTAQPSGGTAPYTYAWYSGATCTGTVLVTTQAYTTPALTATTEYCVAVTDSSHSPVEVTATATVTVSASPLTVSITPAAPSIDSGQTVQLTAQASGGTGADTYAWYSGATCTGTVLATTQEYTSPALTATTTYCVSVTDSAYSPATANATAMVTVSSSPLTVTITPAAPSIDTGQTVQLMAHPSGGAAPDTYAWYSGAVCTGTVVATSQAYTTPALTATTEYCVAATDSSYEPVTATATATVTVSTSPLTVAIDPAAPSIDTGQTVQLTANPSGGTGADTYAWYSGGACSGTVLSTAQVYTSPALTSASEYCVAATDSASTPATATATATVTVSATALTVTITPVDPSAVSGKTVQLTANPSGGTGPYTYAWYLGATCSGTILATSQVYTSPALTAGATYCVSVTDSSSSPVTATAHAAITITPTSTGTSSLPPYVYPAVGAVAALLVALLLLALLARRGRKVTFIQSGLPPETEWSLTFAGTAQRSTASRITFNARKGQFSYLVQDVAGYTAAPSSGAVEVGKDLPDLRIRFTAQPSEPRSSDSAGPVQPSDPGSATSPIPAPAPESGSQEPAGSNPPSENVSKDSSTPMPTSTPASGESAGSAQLQEPRSDDSPVPQPESEPGSKEPAGSAPPSDTGSDVASTPAPAPEPGSAESPAPAPPQESGSEQPESQAQPTGSEPQDPSSSAQPSEPGPGIPSSLRGAVKIRFAEHADSAPPSESGSGEPAAPPE